VLSVTRKFTPRSTIVKVGPKMSGLLIFPRKKGEKERKKGEKNKRLQWFCSICRILS
jgi:hypothetical protein